MPEPSEWLESIARTLDGLPTRWATIGALAANRYRAEERFTTDVDLLAERHPRMEEALAAEGYDVQTVRTRGEPPRLLRLTRGAERVDVLLRHAGRGPHHPLGARLGGCRPLGAGLDVA